MSGCTGMQCNIRESSRASQKSPSRSTDPSEGFVRMRGEAADLARDVGNLMQIHQGEDHRVEDREHLSHRWEADAALILSQGHITTPMESIFHGPMLANEPQEPLGTTVPWQQTGPAVDHLDAVLVFDGAFALQTKDLPHLAPVAAQIVIEIRAGS